MRTSYFDMARGYMPAMPDIPRFLYKYVSVKSALYTLLTEKIYFAHCREFNDPFDGKVVVDFSTEKSRREVARRAGKYAEQNADIMRKIGIIPTSADMEKLRNGIISDPVKIQQFNRMFTEINYRRNVGVFCMSEKSDSFPMWAHYADMHAGCCLKFDMRRRRSIECHWRECFPFVSLGKIKYSGEYPKFPDAEIFAPHEQGSVYMTKSPDWEYEAEWRAVVYDSSVISESTGKSVTEGMLPEAAKEMRGKGAYSLSKGLLAGVILGYEMSDSDREAVVRAARGANLSVDEAKPKEFAYGMKIKHVPDAGLGK